VVTNATIPHSQLNKRHHALAYHRVREAIASNMINFNHISGDSNPADILSKIWGFQQVASQLRELLFWKGTPEGAAHGQWGVSRLQRDSKQGS
jgi:hypothetical protein